jgi:hypothetical protein
MSVPDTLAHPTSDVPTYARVLPIVSLCSSILFAVVSVVTCIALLTISGFGLLVPLIIGLPLSLGGSIFLAFLPALTLRFFVIDQRVTWALWISSVSAVMGGVAWILVETLAGFGGGVC